MTRITLSPIIKGKNLFHKKTNSYKLKYKEMLGIVIITRSQKRNAGCKLQSQIIRVERKDSLIAKELQKARNSQFI